ncbi:MAG: phage integrase N-terminal SAM-like domain-containing protein [Candidatus Bathyarchaeota archaeon]|nr:phage integrase N-terminal SAM-like domain-containing protein [Candidatus Bathyarchaeota archaeon]
MYRRIDIHDFISRLHTAEQRVQAANPITPRNAELIQQFEHAIFAEGLSTGRVTKYVLTLRKLAKWLGKNFDAAKKQDIENLVMQLERSDYSVWTKHDYKVAIKRFYKWLNGGDEYPEAVKWITTTFKKKG